MLAQALDGCNWAAVSLNDFVLGGTRITDLTPLVKLAKLKKLWITETKVSDAEIGRFRKARKAVGLGEVLISR